MFKPILLAALTATVAVFGASVVHAQETTPAPEFDSFVSQTTRAQVIAETQDASSRGLMARNEAEMRILADMGFRSQVSRVQVRAEAAEAIRLGLVVGGEIGAPQATPQQLDQIRAAGLRALEGGSQLART